MINIAVLGSGFGEHHIAIYKKNAHANLKYVYGRNNKKLSEIGRKFSIEWTDNYEQILADDEIDLIDICLPSDLHLEYAVKAIENGKNVFCETPVTYSKLDAEKILDTAERNGKFVFVDLFTKYSAPHQLGISYVKNGTIGEVRYLKIYNKTPPIWGDLSAEKSLFNFFIHTIDFQLEILGAPRKVDSYCVDMDGKSVIEAHFGYNGAIASVTSCSCLPSSSPFMTGFEIIGSTGSLRYDVEFGEKTDQEMILNTGSGNKNISIPATDDYEEVIRHVVSCLEMDRKSDNIDISDAVSSLEIVEKVRNRMHRN
jgi:UDP-N-acetylglucosamine 3-dehydrogenase